MAEGQPQFNKDIVEPRESDIALNQASKYKKGMGQLSSDAASPPTSPSMGAVAAVAGLSGLGSSAGNNMDSGSSGSNAELEALQVPDRLKFDVCDSSDDDEEADSKSAELEAEKKAGEGDAFEEGIEKGGRFKAFEDWLVACGAQFPDLYLKKYTGDVRGVHSTRRIGPYVTLVQIPLKCLITDYMGRTETEIGRKLFSSNYSLSTPNLIAVIIYILTTREEPDHFFQPYYKILPKDYSNFPIFWNEEELDWLTGSPLMDDVVERKRNMRADYDEVVRVCPEFGRFSFEEFLEVRTAVGSRNFGIVVHGNKRTAMVPYADMLNHYRPRETSWTFEDSKDAFTITSLSALQAGQQVMDSYGKKCNAKFLLHYGFAVECNREEDGKCQNEIYLRLSLPSGGDSLRDLRLAVLGPSRRSRGFRLSMNIEDKATMEALSYCRVAVANTTEMAAILAQCGLSETGEALNQTGAASAYRGRYRDGYGRGDCSSVSFVNLRNEIKALSMLAEACREQLGLYPNSYEENAELLAHGNIPPFSTRRTALIVVLGEQEICDFWINASATIGDILKLSEDGMEQEQPLHMALRGLPRTTPGEADLARYGGRLAYEIHVSK